MSLVIPISAESAHFDMQVTLEDVTYTLELRWNERCVDPDQGIEGAWFMNVLDEQGVTHLIDGLKLVVNWPLAAYTTGRNPPGAFIAIDTSSKGREIEVMEDLGSRVVLAYVTSAELAP